MELRRPAKISPALDRAGHVADFTAMPQPAAAKPMIGKRAPQCGRRGAYEAPPRLCVLIRREHDDGRTRLHPIEEIDDILVGHADAAGRYRLADIFRLVGAVDAVQGVLVARVKVERPRAEWIGRTSWNARRVGAQPRPKLLQ